MLNAAMDKDEGGQATWGGRFNEGPDALMVRFSESVSFDRRLAPFDVLGSKAHSAMLCHIGILTPEERDAIHAGLDGILEEIRDGRFIWEARLEDVHMNIEQVLTARVPAAAKLHTARSRNDQIATDVHLFLKYASGRLVHLLEALCAAWVHLAEAHPDAVIPGYTHLQRGQPVLLAHHFLAYAEMFWRDRQRFLDTRKAANVCPLGSGALAGTTLPVDREFVARWLGFVDEEGSPCLTRNSMDAVAARDAHLQFASACAIGAIHLSRVAEDLILWGSSEFGFATLGDAFTTGSSLMPQKKNPDSMELIRGKAARIQGDLQTLLTLCKGLPLTYNRDLQEDKPALFDSYDQTRDCLRVMTAAVTTLKVDPARLGEVSADPNLLATDLADFLVERGLPFREAHHAVGRLVGLAESKGVPLDELADDDAKGVDPAFGKGWREVFDLGRALKRRSQPGMPGPDPVGREIGRWNEALARLPEPSPEFSALSFFDGLG